MVLCLAVRLKAVVVAADREMAVGHGLHRGGGFAMRQSGLAMRLDVAVVSTM
ncbi:coproporphyrinogen III oxidase [Sesbania bispinosa]|nr:coproporphyrinogen III oxidase [Sesbania bispinosa]